MHSIFPDIAVNEYFGSFACAAILQRFYNFNVFSNDSAGNTLNLCRAGGIASETFEKTQTHQASTSVILWLR
jgi:hypothetical protein